MRFVCSNFLFAYCSWTSFSPRAFRITQRQKMYSSLSIGVVISCFTTHDYASSFTPVNSCYQTTPVPLRLLIVNAGTVLPPSLLDWSTTQQQGHSSLPGYHLHLVTPPWHYFLQEGRCCTVSDLGLLTLSPLTTTTTSFYHSFIWLSFRFTFLFHFLLTLLTTSFSCHFTGTPYSFDIAKLYSCLGNYCHAIWD